MADIVARSSPAGAASAQPERARDFSRKYWMFVLPAAVVVGAVIVFPWVFTLWMSAHEWKVTGDHAFVGFDNYRKLAADPRFLESVDRKSVV